MLHIHCQKKEERTKPCRAQNSHTFTQQIFGDNFSTIKVNFFANCNCSQISISKHLTFSFFYPFSIFLSVYVTMLLLFHPAELSLRCDFNTFTDRWPPYHECVQSFNCFSLISISYSPLHLPLHLPLFSSLILSLAFPLCLFILLLFSPCFATSHPGGSL